MTMVRSIVFLIAAIVAIASGDAPKGRPSMKEYKAKKADEAAAKKAAAAAKAKMAAVNKVVTLLTDLQKKVIQEGEDEAATYNKFACFCKDTTTDKTKAISKGSDEKASLSAKIDQLASKRDDLDDKITELVDKIESEQTKIKEAEKTRADELAEYEKTEADLTKAVTSLEGAIKTLKASKAPSLMQLKTVQTTVQNAAMLADALGLAGAKMHNEAAAFLQQAPEVEMENYKFHSDGIIGTLEKLLKDFQKEKEDVDVEEVKAGAAHDSFVQEKTDLVKAKNLELSKAKENKSNKIEKIAAKSKELTTVSADLLDDQQYLSELSKLCTNKAKTWDARSKIRADELAALTTAIDIVKGQVTKSTSGSTVRLVQQGATLRRAEEIAHSEGAMDAMEAEAEAVDDGETAPSLMQVRRVTLTRAKQQNPDGGRALVVNLLRNKAVQLKSTLLTSLASQIAADPFAKIKKLVQELIERLLQEAANEANQKGWCDKASADAKQKRDNSATKVKELNAEMAELEALRDKLTREIAVLGDEIPALEDKQNVTKQERAEEKSENQAAIAEAKEGLKAVKSAIEVLQKFYAKAKKATVDLESMMQESPLDAAPDAGFDNGEAYTGAQGGASGILGMLDVIKSDFKRTVSETTSAEEEAQDDFVEFMTETGKSLAEKKEAKKQKIDQLDDTEDKLATADDNIKSQSKILNEAIKELMDLKPACEDTGMSYEERVARREDEIESLKKALCILRAYAEFGPN